MQKFNLGRTAPEPEGGDPETHLGSAAPEPEGGDPETTIDVGEAKPPRGAGKNSRLLVIVGALVIVAGGGYLALRQFTQFMAPQPKVPARPIRPLAKGPSPSPGTPPAAAPAPTKQAPAGQVAPGPAAPPAASAKAAQSAAPQAETAGPQKAVQSAAPAPAAKAEAKGPAPTKAEPSKLAKAAPQEAPAAPTPPPARPAQVEGAAGTFSLQVGAMINEGNAQKLKQRLEQLGYTPVIRKGKANLRRHVVTTGDYGDRSGAEDVVKRLAAQGIAARVITAGGRFSVEAGSFANEDDAIDLARQLQQFNYPPRIQDQAQNATIYQVRVGSFPSRADAQAKGAELKGKGFPYLVVKN